MTTITRAELDSYYSGMRPVVDGLNAFEPTILGWVGTMDDAATVLSGAAVDGECHTFIAGDRPRAGAFGVWLSGAVFAKRLRCWRRAS